jgi:hypothetical protein
VDGGGDDCRKVVGGIVDRDILWMESGRADESEGAVRLKKLVAETIVRVCTRHIFYVCC